MKRAPLNRRSKTPRAKLIRILDRLWQEAVCLASGRKCARCGSSLGVSGHHLIKRSNLVFRHDLRNGVCLCLYCHQRAEVYQMEFEIWLQKYSPPVYAWLQSNGHYKPRPVLTHELEERRASWAGGISIHVAVWLFLFAAWLVCAIGHWLSVP